MRNSVSRKNCPCLHPVALLAALLVLQGVTGRGPAFGQTAAPATARHDTIVVKDLEAAISQGEDLIRKYPDSDFTPSVMFQLVELYVKRSAYEYQTKMATYEQELKRFDTGEISSEPHMPRISHGKAIEMGYRVLQQYPTASFNDKVVYRIALCQLEEGNRDQARNYFAKLLDEYPKSEYVLEASFRLGEHYFDKKEYQTAVEYYSKLLNQWQNPFFDMALYKLAWSYFNVNNFPRAISTFIYLIDDLNLVDKARDAQVLGKTKMDLRREAIEYLAQSFAEYGGPRRAREFLDQFRGKEYGIDIFLKLADIYQTRNYYEESTKTLEITLELWPLYAEAPLLQNKIVENYLRSGDARNAELARENLVNNYGPGSAWIQKYPQGEVRDKALALAEQNLYILGTEAQSRAQETQEVESYRRAIQLYQQFVQKFPQSESAAKVVYYTAECHYDIKDFAAAAEAYQRVLLQYPTSEFRDEAAYNRILSHFQELGTAPPPDTTRFVLANFLAKGSKDTLTVPNAVYPKLLNASNDFAILLAQSEHLPEVLMKYGETLYQLQAYGMAQQVYEKIINDLPQSNFVVQAHLLHAQCAMDKKEYLDAEKWARRVVENFPDSTRQVARAHRVISSAKFKLAEGFKERQDFATAARAFENIAASTPDTTIGELALAEAAQQFDQAGDKEKAIATYEKFYLKFPRSPRVDEALFRTALLCEQLEQWTRAAQNYLTLVTARPNSPYAARAVFAAARCYENGGLMENALKTYDRFLAEFDHEIDQCLEALCRAGEICYNRKDFDQATTYFRRAVTRYQQAAGNGHAAEPYMAAQAQFNLGEIRFEAYRLVKLEPPLERSLQRKQALFNEVLAAYKDAATYQIAEWYTAASFRIGASYEEFGRAFWESPRPSLAADLMTQYEEQLAQRIRPFKERAYETYKGNIRQAEEHDIANQWVEQSRQRMHALALELGYEQAATPPVEGVPAGGEQHGDAAQLGGATPRADVNTAAVKGSRL